MRDQTWSEILIAEVIQEGFLGEDSFELSFGGWLLVPFGFSIKKKQLLVSFPRLLWEAMLEVCAGKDISSPLGSFSCRSAISLDQVGEQGWTHGEWRRGGDIGTPTVC